VDNVKENFSLTEENGLHIKSFMGEEDDFELNELAKDLKSNLLFNLYHRTCIK
jgi:hypothetical protein